MTLTIASRPEDLRTATPLARGLVIAAAVAISAVVSACGRQTAPPEVLRLTPSTISSLGARNAVVEGRNFYLRGVFDADAEDSGANLTLEDQFTVTIGSVSLTAPNVTFVDPEHLAVVLPAGLPVGVHAVRVTRPDGVESAPAADALTVVDTPVGLTLALEDAPGGSGAPIGAVELTAGESLTLNAVLRDDLGTFITDADVSWEIDAAIGSIDAGPATAAVFAAEHVGSGTVHAFHADAGEAVTPPLTVIAAAATHVTIEDAPSGAGTEVGDRADLTADDALALYAVARDDFGNFVSDESGAWALTGDAIAEVATDPSSSVLLALEHVGTARLTLSHATLAGDESGELTVRAGALARVRVESAAGGTGSEIGALTLTAGSTTTVYAVGYDADGNVAGDTPVTWSVTGGIAPVLVVTPAALFELHATTAGTGQVVATPAAALGDASGDIVVNPGPLDRIVVETAPDGGGGEVRDLTLTADGSASFYTVARDANGNFIRNMSVSWQWLGSCDALGGLDRHQGYAVTFTPSATGSCWLAATHESSGSDLTGRITVTAGQPASVTIEDKADGTGSPIGAVQMTSAGPLCSSACASTCGACAFHAVMRDQHGNFSGLGAATWQLLGDIGGVAPGVGPSVTLTAGAAGDGLLGATVPDVGVDFTDTITVVPGAFSQIRIEDAGDGLGDPIATLSLAESTQVKLYAVGRDAAFGYVPGVCDDVVWQVAAAIGTVSGSNVGCSITLQTAAVSTEVQGAVTVDKPSWGLGVDDTLQVTVRDGTINAVFVSDDAATCANYSGALTADDSVKLYAVGCNGTSFLGLVDGAWSFDAGGNVIGTLAPATGTATRLDLTRPGTGRVKASAMSGMSGDITVTPGVTHRLVIEDSAGGAGSEVGALSRTAGTPMPLYAVGRDRDDNFTANLSVSWSVLGGIGSLACSPSCGGATSATLTPRRVGQGLVAAAHATAGSDQTGTITVTAGPPVAIAIKDAPGGSGNAIPDQKISADDSLRLYAVEEDAFGNWVADTVVSWSLDPSMDRVGTLAAGPSGTTVLDAVMASDKGGVVLAKHPVRGTAKTGVIVVTAGNAARLSIETRPQGSGREVGDITLDGNGAVDLFATVRDADGNFVADAGATWSITGTIGPINPGPATSVTFKPAARGQGVVTANVDKLAPTTTGTITVGCVVYVDLDASGPGMPSGRSWREAVRSVQEGIDVARASGGPCEVWVAEGTYYICRLCVAASRETLTLRTGVSVYGGFTAVETYRGPDRDWQAHSTVLDGGKDSNHLLRAYHVVTGADGALLDGFTVTMGQADGLATDRSGAGMINYKASPVVRNCTFVDNVAIAFGGGMYNELAAPVVENCRFARNTASAGGGVYNGAPGANAAFSLLIHDSVVEGNHATGSGAGFGGGGMYNGSSATAVVERCFFRGNDTIGSGGALYAHDTSDTTIIDCRFVTNNADADGGGIDAQKARLVITGSELRDNATKNEGGALNVNNADVDVQESLFIGNTAEVNGGAIYDNASNPVMTNCLFARNTATRGGALFTTQSSTPRLLNCTMTKNAATNGGAIRVYSLATVTVTNSILWNDGTEIEAGGGTSVATYSDIGGGHVGDGNIDEDPRFFSADDDLFQIMAGSTCIDAAFGTGAPATDLAGHARVDDPATKDTGAGSPTWIDMGAYEYVLGQ